MKILVQLILTLTIGGSAVVICLQILRFLLPDGISKWLYRIGKIAIVLYLAPIAILLQWIFTKYVSISEKTIFISDPAIVSDISTHGLHFSISIQMVVWLFSLWVLGIIVFACWHIYCYVTFTKTLKSTHEDVPENSEVMKQFTRLKNNLHIKGNVKLKYSREIRSPFLIGLWNPIIYLPKFYHEEANTEMIIHHELIHLKRKDVWIKTFALIANVIHWFNPFIYLLRKDIHKWSELTCDEEVVKYMSKEERKHYGHTIINAMIGTKELPVQFCSSLSDGGKQLKRRLNNMLHVKKDKKSTVLFSVIATVVIGLIGTSTAVWASEKTPEINQPVEEDVIIQEKYNETDQSGQEVTEVEFLPESDATKEQIETHQQLFDDSDADADFWADVEEDSVLTNEDTNNINIISEVELEAGIFVEVE